MGRRGGAPDRRRVPSSHDRWAASPERTGRRRRRGRGGLGVAGRGGALMTDSRTRTIGPRLEEAADAVAAPPHEPVDHVPSTVHRTHPHRRPSGAPPPLPRASVHGQGMADRPGRARRVDPGEPVVGMGPAADRPGRHRDPARDRPLRTPWLTSVKRGIDRIGLGWLFTVAGLGLIVALMVFRRWRHLFTFLGGVILVQIIGVALGFRFSDHDPTTWSPSIAGRASRSRRHRWPSRSSSASV